jgi:hypothetical protein
VAALSYYAGYQQGFSDADEKAAALIDEARRQLRVIANRIIERQ